MIWEICRDCKGLIAIILFPTMIIFIADFRGLHHYGYWGNEDWHLVEGKPYIGKRLCLFYVNVFFHFHHFLYHFRYPCLSIYTRCHYTINAWNTSSDSRSSYRCLHDSCFHCTVLYCPVLSCTVLCCPVLHCPVLSCPVLYWPVVTCTVKNHI
jgi:hypothetical protein